MLNYEFPPLGGGAGNANYFLLKEFSKNETLNIDLVTSSVSNYRIEKFSSNITIHFLDIGKRGDLLYQSNKNLIKYFFKAWFYCKKLKKNNNFDLIHAFFGIPCGYIAYKLKQAYIISLRGSDVPGHNIAFNKMHKLLFYINRKTWRNANYIIANSEDLKNTALLTNFTNKVDVISNGVDCTFFKPNEIKKNNEVLNLLFTGRLNKVKKVDLIIRAISELDDVILNIVGDGPELIALQDLVVSLGIQKKINFLYRKNHTQLKEIYNQNDVFILISSGEGGSNVVLEALASGLPVIISNTGGADKLVSGNGFILDEVSHQMLKEKIIYFIKNRNEISRMGFESRKIAEELSWESAARKYIEIYNTFINTSKKKP